MKRKDNWTPEEDRVLAEIVLKHVSQASTQLKAFEEAANKLNRTPAAVGFRWNSKVRKDYEKELEEAKRKRKEFKQISKTKQSQTDESLNELLADLSVDQRELIMPIIRYIKAQSHRGEEEYQKLLEKYQRLEKEYEQLREMHQRLFQLLAEVQDKWNIA
mgnify:CR=1 FL=1